MGRGRGRGFGLGFAQDVELGIGRKPWRRNNNPSESLTDTSTEGLNKPRLSGDAPNFTCSEGELEQLCDFWQEELKLGDWKVEVVLTRSFEMNADSQGECHYRTRKRMAVVKLLDARDFSGYSAFPQDHEITLVHELLHLVFSYRDHEEGGMDRSDLSDVLEEQAVDALAHTLVNLKRAGEDKP